ncbi:MAG TPA: outer membrane beta-barrel protein [Saprospiraceae bacterium]|nr:outer membrane beta-barrel protein [Saprospiraceae bacterium]
MKKVMWSLVVILCIATAPLVAQFQINPQIGVNYTDVDVELSDIGVNPKTHSKAGVLAGVDLRLGTKVYVQPGLFVIGSKIGYNFGTDEYEITRYGAKLKALLGLKLIDSAFRLRVMGGPSYDFQLGLNGDDNPYFDKEDFKKGIFNIDAGVGIDVLFLTAELGYSWAFTETFDENFFDNKPRYESIYFTVGIVLGE